MKFSALFFLQRIYIPYQIAVMAKQITY